MSDTAELHITGLFIYPVKSLRGIAVARTALRATGLRHDRRWMVTDHSGRFVTQRQLPHMARIATALTSTDLVLQYDGERETLAVPLRLPPAQQAGIGDVQVWDDRCLAHDEGDAAARWLTRLLGPWAGGELRLKRFAKRHPRAVEADYLHGDSAHTHFADGYPFLLATEASLAQLNRQLEQAGSRTVGMAHFRPNIVVRGGHAFDEDRIDRLEGGHYALTLRKPCQRCKIITIDPRDGSIPEPGQPLRTLAASNVLPGLRGAFFGQNATLAHGGGGLIRVGDTLRTVFRPPG